jgi:hypothetical protein
MYPILGTKCCLVSTREASATYKRCAPSILYEKADLKYNIFDQSLNSCLITNTSSSKFKQWILSYAYHIQIY